ncbi:hypothetical protein ACMFMF_008788 [Clarireedia jacksonii]
MSCLADAIRIEDDDAMDINSDGRDGKYLSPRNLKSPSTPISASKHDNRTTADSLIVRAVSPAISLASTCTLRGSPEPASTSPLLARGLNQPQFNQPAQSTFQLPPAMQRTSEVHMSETADRLVRSSNDSDDTQRLLQPFVRTGFSLNDVDEMYDFLEAEDNPDSFRPEVTRESIMIDLEAAEYQAEREEQISNSRLSIKADAIPQRNPPIVPPLAEVESFEWQPGQHLRRGKTVQLIDNTFLKIMAVVKNLAHDTVSLRGWKLERTRDAGGRLPKKRNELVFIHEIDADDNRPLLEQSVVEINLSHVLRIRMLVCTNKRYPQGRYNPADIPPGTKAEMLKWVEDNGLLVARWSYICRYGSNVSRVAQNPDQSRKSAILRMLTEDECSIGEYIEPEIRRLTWRGATVPGGSRKATQNSTAQGERKSIAEANCDKDKESRSVERTYTFGDIYCGAGGMTCAAVLAGLKVVYGVDLNRDAGQTWEKNFSPAWFLGMSVHDFSVLPDPSKDFIVDILHLSPPCQMFSPVKTRPGRNDEFNYASLFGVGEAIKKARPRVATLEQTFGIMAMQHTETFNALIRMFTDLQYDVSWEIKEFQSYGLPQSRKRLIIIASCPGESLPSIPAYTHYDPALPFTRTHLNMLPHTTPNTVLSQIPPNAPNHDPAYWRLNIAYYTPWDGTKISTCVMTSGAERKGHPNGERGLTNRELAQLQSVPLWMEFFGFHVRRQIGNMVPPMVGKVLLQAVRKHLQEADRVEMEKEKERKKERAKQREMRRITLRDKVVKGGMRGAEVIVLD